LYWLIIAIPVIAFCVWFFLFYLVQVYPRGKRRTKNEPEIKDVEDPKPEQGWLELELLELAVGPPNEGEGKSPEPVASDDICRPPSSFHRPSPLKKSDILPMLLITAIYGVIAFLGLGSTDTPESFCIFEDSFSSAVLRLADNSIPDKLCVFTGIGTGKYQIRTSADGETWTDCAEFEQKYSELLKWKTVEFPEETGPVSHIEITATKPKMFLGEIRLYDAAGSEIRLFAEDEAAERLIDEANLPMIDNSYLYNSYFDEIYHARTAYEHILNIYPYEISHPPLGKIIIGMGIRLFGFNPFGWRFSGTLFGILMLPLIYIFIKNLFGKTIVASCGTLIFAFDFMHFVQTRIATIDTYGVFFIILMYYFMYRYLVQDYDTPLRKTLFPLFLSGLFFGLGAASKWTAVYSGLGLLIIYVMRQVIRGGYYKKLGDMKAFRKYLAATLLASLVFFVIIPVSCYYLSYIPYGTAKGMSVSEGMLRDPKFMKLVWDNQKFMFSYHGNLVAEHPYSSPWWQWVLDLRPILYYLQDLGEGYKSSFAAFGNPVVWWTGIGAVISLIIALVKRRDKIAAFILIGYFVQLAPWMIISRIVFIYHYFPNVVFIVLGLSYMFNDLYEKKRSRTGGAVPLFTATALLLFMVFYPVLTGVPISRFSSQTFLRWFAGMWPF
jgi:dolichyl-phosphate-mannose-protein mannosyltransferase